MFARLTGMPELELALVEVLAVADLLEDVADPRLGADPEDVQLVPREMDLEINTIYNVFSTKS